MLRHWSALERELLASHQGKLDEDLALLESHHGMLENEALWLPPEAIRDELLDVLLLTDELERLLDDPDLPLELAEDVLLLTDELERLLDDPDLPLEYVEDFDEPFGWS